MSVITLTESAKQYLLNACKNENKSAIRLQVIGGGCAGFSYNYSFALDKDPLDISVVLDETHEFVLDNTSLMYVIGTVLDYEHRLGSSSLVIKNPNEVSSCGCGKSFSI